MQVLLIQYQNQVSDHQELMIQANQLMYNYDIASVCNAILAGLVSITASGYNVELWTACLIGSVGSVIYT